MRYSVYFLLLPALLSCELKVKTSTSSKEKIRNGIELNEKGLKASQAYLIYEDGSLVEEGNKINVNEKVILRLLLDGFKEDNGKVQPGATEKITTSEGQVLLDSDDLFAAYSDGVSAKDAKIVTLSAVITAIDKLYDHFVVQFRVWDKKEGGGEITGSYKLYLR